MKLYYVMARHKKTKATHVPTYYGGLSVFASESDAIRRIRTLRRRVRTHEYRMLPWHSEMGEVDAMEMWRSAWAVAIVKAR
jgi:hypothetical protein